MNIDCSASLRNCWQSHYQVVDLKEKSAFDFRVLQHSLFMNNIVWTIIIPLKFSNLKPCNWAQGYICQGEEVERTLTVITIMSCQLICNEKSKTIPHATSLEAEDSFRDWWQSNYQVLDRKEESAFAHKVTALSVYEKYCLTLSGPRGGGGGLRGPDDQTHSCQSETSYSMMPKLCDF